MHLEDFVFLTCRLTTSVCCNRKYVFMCLKICDFNNIIVSVESGDRQVVEIDKARFNVPPNTL